MAAPTPKMLIPMTPPELESTYADGIIARGFRDGHFIVLLLDPAKNWDSAAVVDVPQIRLSDTPRL